MSHRRSPTVRHRAAVACVAVVVFAACDDGGADGNSSGPSSPATSSPSATSVVSGPGPSAGTGPTIDSSVPTVTPETTVPPSTAPPTTIEPVLAVGDAVLIESQVDLRSVDTAEFTPLADPTPVAVGDVLRTDDTGYGEIAYFDGSRTRLDVNTEFEILELVDQASQSLARTRMGLGRTWHRVEALGETEGGFSVETLVATATVRGTAFSIDCTEDDSCGFSVMEGTIELTLLDGTTIQLVAPARLEIVDGVAGQPLPLPFDQAFGDDWLLDNADRDSQVGFTDAPAMYLPHGPAFATVSGNYDTSSTFVGETCPSGACVGYADAGAQVPGTTSTGSASLELDCSRGFPCTGTRGGATPATFDGLIVTSTRDAPNAIACLHDDNGDGVGDREAGRITIELTLRLVPTRAAARNGRWQVTRLDGQLLRTDVVVDGGGCAEMQPGQRTVFTYQLVWTLA